VSSISYDSIQADSDAIAYGGDPSKGCELFSKDEEVQFMIGVTQNLIDIEVKTASTMQTCLTKAYFSNLGYKGFFGITGSNKSNLRPYKSIDLVRTNFWNLSPKFYKKPVREIDPV